MIRCLLWLTLALVAPSVAIGSAAAEPLALRVGWVVVPAELTPILFAHPGIAQHEGRSYRLEPVHFKGSPLALTAFAAGDIEIGGFGYSTIANAIVNGGLRDLRVIGDIAQDGVEGWSSNGFFVLRDSPIQRIEDLRGRVLAVQTVGSLLDVTERAMLRRHGLDETRDATVIEIAYPNMKAALLARKVDLIGLIPPFLMDAELPRVARLLFTQREAIGVVQISTLVARAGFIAEHRAALVDFLEDNARAVRWYLDPANHAEAVRIVGDFFKQPPQQFDWAFTHEDQYRDPNLKPDIAAMQANIALARGFGLIKADLDIHPYVDLGPVEEAIARIGVK
jgi:sulfonate transport system substrate-binding protein